MPLRRVLPPLSSRPSRLRRIGIAVLLACLSAASAAADADPTRIEVERLMRESRHDAARQRIDAALRARPDDAAMRFLSAVLHAQVGSTADAETTYRQLIADHPDLPEPYNNLAVLHAARGDWDGARALLEKAVRNDPRYLIAHRNLGDVFARLALRAYETAAGASPGDDALARRLRLARELTTAGAGQ